MSLLLLTTFYYIRSEVVFFKKKKQNSWMMGAKVRKGNRDKLLLFFFKNLNPYKEHICLTWYKHSDIFPDCLFILFFQAKSWKNYIQIRCHHNIWASHGNRVTLNCPQNSTAEIHETSLQKNKNNKNRNKFFLRFLTILGKQTRTTATCPNFTVQCTYIHTHQFSGQYRCIVWYTNMCSVLGKGICVEYWQIQYRSKVSRSISNKAE